MDTKNQVGDVIKGFSFRDYDATVVSDGSWTVGTEVDVNATGEWLVVEAYMTGGGSGHGPFDSYPDAWHVVNPYHFSSLCHFVRKRG